MVTATIITIIIILSILPGSLDSLKRPQTCHPQDGWGTNSEPYWEKEEMRKEKLTQAEQSGQASWRKGTNQSLAG